MEPDWDDLKCFVAIARHGSLTEAGAALGVSPATIGRRIDGLEKALGLTLVKRHHAGAVLTQAGEAILACAEPGARHLAQVARVARAYRAIPQDTPIRVSSTESMIADVLAPRIGELLDAAPHLRIEFVVSNELSNLNNGEADIAIRLSAPKSDTLLTRKLPAIRLGLFCSKAYLGKRKADALVLTDERLLWLDPRYGPIPENNWITEQDLEHAVRLRSSSVRALHNAVAANAGIAPLPVFSAARSDFVEIAAPPLPKRHPWLVFHRDTRDNKPMKTVRDWIAQSCRIAFA